MSNPSDHENRVKPVASLKPATGPTINFYSFSEIVEFSQSEQAAWDPLRREILQRGDGWLLQLKHMLMLQNRLEDKANQADDQEPGGPAASELRTMLADWDGRYFVSDSPEGQAAIAVAAEDWVLGAVLVGSPLVVGSTLPINIGGQGLSVSLPKFISAYVRVELARHNIPDLSLRQAGFDQLHRKVQQQIEDTKTAVENSESATVSARNEHAVMLNKHRDDLNEAVKGTKRALKAQVELAKSVIAEAEKVYLENIKIDAAATYWQTISDKSASRARWQFGFFLGFSAAAVAAAAAAIWFAAQGLPVETIERFAKLGLVATAMISLPIVLVLWILKHLARGLVDAQRVGADARHRATLVETYLALLKDHGARSAHATETGAADGKPEEKKSISETDEKVRLLMLGAIFSHPGAGNEAETLPATIVEAVIGKK